MEPTILLWLGSASEGGLKLFSVTGDDLWVSRLFRDGESLSHPHSRHAVFPRQITSQREDWIRQVGSGELTPLRQSYQIIETKNDAGENEVSVGVIETISVASVISGSARTSVDDNHSLVGMFEVITDDGASERRLQQTQRSLHKINNELSIASLALDVLTLRLEQSANQFDTQPWMDSCNTASRAVIRAGKIANETMHKMIQQDREM